MARKTFEVATLVDEANDMLKKSASDMVEFRKGVSAMIERVLHDTGNYNGYRSLYADEVADGFPGCRPHNGDRYVMPNGDTTNTYEPHYADTWFHNTDDTRRQYS
ncbi:hypothetical protein DRQ53_08620 [bacterium]|nr:MAG: hypothetical protein DRQ53_08620 [bacterium]